VYIYIRSNTNLSSSASCFLSLTTTTRTMGNDDKESKGDSEQVIITDADELQLVNALSR
jgi:hypothetical protein